MLVMISEYDVHKKYRNVSKNKKVMNINKNTIVLPVCNNAFYFHCSIFFEFLINLNLRFYHSFFL